MLELREFDAALLTHALTPMGPIPTVHDPNGVYPYESFAATSPRPVPKRHRFVALENDFLRVTICPDLGGKVHSLCDKRSGKEVLFVPASIHPVRILPRLAFVPGGIEVSFPISHTPVQLEAVHCQSRRVGDRLHVWCGERELRFGMQWTVEYSLGERAPFLTQRTFYRNPTARAHPWMSWSNAAVPARADTEFHFPAGSVLRHGATLETIDWASAGPRRVGDLKRMAGFFWLEPDVCAFGAFTPSLGHGLYHIADPAVTPGIKLWSYGVGPQEIWGRAASLSGEGYVEIQGGPLRDQSIKEVLRPGQARFHVEFWLPSSRPLEIRALKLPQPGLLSPSEIPWFDWPPREALGCWLALLSAHARQTISSLSEPPPTHDNSWAPSGMDDLGEALAWAGSVTSTNARDRWLFQLGTWLAARGQVEAALETLARSGDDRARALRGRLCLRAKHDPRAAVESFRGITSEAVTLHPQVMVERDVALAELGTATLAERAQWFVRAAHLQDEWLVERKAAWLVDEGRFAEARALLEQTAFQLVHQRYVRTRLWQRIKQELNLTEPDPPNWLGEDDLGDFGAYREFAEKPPDSTDFTLARE